MALLNPYLWRGYVRGGGWLTNHDHRACHTFLENRQCLSKFDEGPHVIVVPFWTAGNFSPIEGSFRNKWSVIPLLFTVPCITMLWKPSNSFPKLSWRTLRYRNFHQLSQTSSRPFPNTNITSYALKASMGHFGPLMAHTPKWPGSSPLLPELSLCSRGLLGSWGDHYIQFL